MPTLPIDNVNAVSVSPPLSGRVQGNVLFLGSSEPASYYVRLTASQTVTINSASVTLWSYEEVQPAEGGAWLTVANGLVGSQYTNPAFDTAVNSVAAVGDIVTIYPGYGEPTTGNGNWERSWIFNSGETLRTGTLTPVMDVCPTRAAESFATFSTDEITSSSPLLTDFVLTLNDAQWQLVIGTILTVPESGMYRFHAHVEGYIKSALSSYPDGTLYAGIFSGSTVDAGGANLVPYSASSVCVIYKDTVLGDQKLQEWGRCHLHAYTTVPANKGDSFCLGAMVAGAGTGNWLDRRILGNGTTQTVLYAEPVHVTKTFYYLAGLMQKKQEATISAKVALATAACDEGGTDCCGLISVPCSDQPVPEELPALLTNLSGCACLNNKTTTLVHTVDSEWSGTFDLTSCSGGGITVLLRCGASHVDGTHGVSWSVYVFGCNGNLDSNKWYAPIDSDFVFTVVITPDPLHVEITIDLSAFPAVASACGCNTGASYPSQQIKITITE